jgi:hypothetical protein
MAGRYRALLIGNSTYPADEHNLQTLKGPVKDIAVLNRALVDPQTGLFADVDVTLLPEASSTRALRALGTFFTTADRDDVLLVYFSGHGKLDRLGRLHLCMQDTETTDLLSTAVSSVRINEFADASRAHNVVIILDCCYAGAFRGGDFGDTVAGPGRYVMTSCRGTQLANDATVDNGTSFFTQHLVEGLTHAADQDGDGYVSFSDLYTYVDRALREDGKQIPQRRVDADGDVRLAKRPVRAAAAVDDDGPVAARPASPPESPPRAWARPRIAIIGAAAAAVIAGAVTAVLVLQSSGGSRGGRGSGATLEISPDHGRISTAFVVSGTGCPGQGRQINIVFDAKSLADVASCQANHTYTTSYSPDPNGVLPWADGMGNRHEMTLSPGMSYIVYAQTPTGDWVSPRVTYRVE